MSSSSASSALSASSSRRRLSRILNDGHHSGPSSSGSPPGRSASSLRRLHSTSKQSLAPSRPTLGFQLDNRRIVDVEETKLPPKVADDLERSRSRPDEESSSADLADVISWDLDLGKKARRVSQRLMRADLNANLAASSSRSTNRLQKERSFRKSEKSEGKLPHVLTHGGSATKRVPSDSAQALGISDRVKELQQRNVNFRQHQPTAVNHIPFMRESEEQKLLRENNAKRSAKLRSRALAASAASGEDDGGDEDGFGNGLGTALVVHQSPNQVSLHVNSREPAAGKPLPVDKTKFRMDEEIVTKMMMELDAKQLQRVKRDFNEKGGELNLHEFVAVMMKYQPESESAEAEVNAVAKLCEFFHQVDINGDQSMELQEFTSYIVESSQDRDNFRVDNIKRYDPSPIPPMPSVTYDTRVDHVYYVEELDHLVACDTNRMLSVYEASNFSLLKRAAGHKGVIHGATYLQGRGASSYLATVANDSTIGFWDTHTYSMCQQVPCEDVQMSIEWGGAQHDRLFTGGLNGNINVWNVESLECAARLQGHNDIVMDLHCIESMGVIASASLDSQIKFWDIPTQTLRKSLPGHAKGAFSLAYAPEYRFLISAGFDHDAMVWNPYVERLITPLKGHNSSLVGVKAIPNTPEIITADNEGFFKIWDIRNFSCVQTFAMRDAKTGPSGLGAAGQAGANEGAAIFANPARRTSAPAPVRASHIGAVGNGGGPRFRGAAMLGSGSSAKAERMQGELRQNIENRRNMATSLLFNHSLKMSDIDTAISCFAYSTKHRRIVAANHDLRLFDYDRPTDPKLTDTSTTIGVIFNETALTFTTAAGRSVKLWDAESGRLIRIYRDISKSEITALCFDGRRRKFITGDHEGRVTVFNLANGAHMKDLSPHASEIVALQSLAAEQRIVSSSWDGVIKVSDESDPEAAVVLMEISHPGAVASLLRTIPGAAAYREGLERKYLTMRKQQLGGVTTFASFGMQHDLTAMACSKRSGQLASAALDATICLFNGETGASDAMCMGHEVDVCALRYLDPHPFLVSGDVHGKVFLWRTHPVVYKCMPWMTFLNDTAQDSRYALPAAAAPAPTGKPSATMVSSRKDSSVETGNAAIDEDRAPEDGKDGEEEDAYAPAITCLEWDEATCMLIVGDEEGSVRYWDLGETLEEAAEEVRQRHHGPYSSMASTRSSPQPRARPEEDGPGRDEPLAHPPQVHQPEPEASFFLTEGAKRAAVEPATAPREDLRPTAPQEDRPTALGSKPSVRAELAKLKTARDARLARAGPQGRLQPALQLHWRAHRAALRSVRLIEELDVLATSSADRMVRLWAKDDGALMGSLYQGSAQDRFADADWKVPVNRAAQQRATLANAQQVLDAIARPSGRVPRIDDDDDEMLLLADTMTASTGSLSDSASRGDREESGSEIASSARNANAKDDRKFGPAGAVRNASPTEKKKNHEKRASQAARAARSGEQQKLKQAASSRWRGAALQAPREPLATRFKLAPEIQAAADKLFRSLRSTNQRASLD